MKEYELAGAFLPFLCPHQVQYQNFRLLHHLMADVTIREIDPPQQYVHASLIQLMYLMMARTLHQKNGKSQGMLMPTFVVMVTLRCLNGFRDSRGNSFAGCCLCFSQCIPK
jgi:hypothetical protein